MEHGFYHPSRGYWQTNSEPPQHILDGYPEGTVEVPLKPGANYEWGGAKARWANATSIKRDAPLIERLRVYKNLTPEQVDGLFAINP